MNLGYYGDNDSYALGIVEDINDPLRAGRVRVRVYGLHSDSADELPFTDLPWSQVLLPATEAGITGIGQAPVGIRVGSIVYGRYLDGDSKQNLLVIGVMSGISSATTVQGRTVGAGELVGASNTEKAYNFFKANGLSDILAAGIVGSMAVEVGADLPTTKRKSGAYGLGLWKGDRFDEYKAYAASKGKVEGDLQTQLEFVYSELRLTSWPSYLTKDKTNSTPTTVEAASDSFTQNYYRKSTKTNAKKRKTLAYQVLSTYELGEQLGPIPAAAPANLKELGAIVQSFEDLYALLAGSTRSIKELIVHHTDTYENMQTDAFDVNDWHIARGFDGIGYHFLILRDGRIQIGRDVNKTGSHARKRNTGTVGIAFVGGRKGHSSSGKIVNSSETFTDPQWAAFNGFIKVWLKVFPNSSIIGHGDVQNDRTDPNFDVRAYVANLSGKDIFPPPAVTPPTPTVGAPSIEPEEEEAVEETPAKKAEPLDVSAAIVPPENTPTYASSTPVPTVTLPVAAPTLAPAPVAPPAVGSPFSNPISSILGSSTPILPEGVAQLSDVVGLLNGYVSLTSLTTILGDYLTDISGETLASLFDVDQTGVVDGHVLTYQSGVWVAQAPTGGGSVAWADITGKPTEFPPEAHTHIIADVTGLQAALDGKALASHTHAAGDIISGTFADARIAQSNVTQHQAALSIGWAQLTGVPSTFTPSAHTHGLADITDFGAAGGYIRSNGSAWVRVSGVAYSDLTGVPSTFAPSAHTHTLSEISDMSAFARTLNDDADAAAMRTTLGLVIGTNVQAYNANLAAFAGLTLVADRLPYANGAGTLALATFTSFARTLLDDADAATARTTLGLAIGTNVQAYSANLAAFAGLSLVADRLPYADGIGTLALATFTSFARTLLDDVDASAARTTLGLVIGTNVQAYDAELAALAGLVSAADRLPYFTGVGTAALATFTSFARTLLDDADAATARTTLGAAALASPAFTGTPTAPTAAALTNNTQIATTAYVDSAVSAGVAGAGALLAANNLSDLANVATARTNLGLVIGTNVQAYSANLAAFAGLTLVADRLPYADGAGTLALATFTAFGRSLIDDADAATARTTLGLGTAATANTGTSGATIPLLNGTNTWSGAQTLSSNLNLSSATTVNLNSETLIRRWTSSNTDIDGVVPGVSALGHIFEGPLNAHFVIGIRGNDTTDGFHIIDNTNDGTTTYSRLLFTLTPTTLQYLGNNIWHAANDGTGSGLDADLLDGVQLSAIGQLAVANTWTQNQTVSGTGVAQLRTSGDIVAYRSGGTTGAIYFNSALDRYLFWDGTNYILNGANLSINGSQAVTLGATQTLTNKTLTSPTINGAALSGTFSGNHTKSGVITFSAANAHIFNTAAATQRLALYQSGGSNRWAVGVDNTAESGSGAGSNFVFYNYSDAGAFVSTVLNLNRANGNATFSGAIRTGNGTAAAPAWSYSGDTDTGFFWNSANIITFSSAGTARFNFSDYIYGDTSGAAMKGAAGTAALPSFTFTGDTNTGMYSDAADTIKWSTGGVLRLTLSTTALTADVDVVLPNAGPTSTLSAGFRGTPINSQAGNYTLVLGDAGWTILYTGTGGHTHTIPANASVAYPIGTTITFINDNTGSLSIAITTDTMRLVNSTSTGTRTLASRGMATAVKVAATTWYISGAGLT